MADPVEQLGPVMYLRGCSTSLQLLGLVLCCYLSLKVRLLEHIHVPYCMSYIACKGSSTAEKEDHL